MDISKGMSHTLPVGWLLALTGGFLDVYTYICRGGVFANAQTGNMVLLGVSMVRGDFLKALYYFIPILAFVAGVIISEIICNKFIDTNQFHWRQIIILVEIIVLIAAAFMPVTRLNNIIVNIAASFVCSLQVETFRIINDSVITTTMCTGNLRSAAEMYYKYRIEKRPEQKKALVTYFSTILMFIVGAILGSVLSVYMKYSSVLVLSVPLLVVFLLMFIREKTVKEN